MSYRQNEYPDTNQNSDSEPDPTPMRMPVPDPWKNGGPCDLSTRERIELGTDRIRSALDQNGNPENEFKIIMVGGTNGKTCTTHFTAQLLRKAGLKVGTFSTPHPEDPAREVQVNGRPIDAESIGRLIPAYYEFEPNLTSFELKVCTALEYFKRENVDIGIMEMGMGGREDAVNIRPPDMAVITNVELDHTDHLGPTIEEIAENKGDIIPEDGVLVTAARPPGRDVLDRMAEMRNATLVTPHFEEYLPHLFHLMVDHHKENASLAMETALQFGFAHPKLFPQKISTLNLINWAQRLTPPGGRFQVIPIGNEIKMILDGAHNPAGFKALFGDLKRFFRERHEQPLVVIMGILGDKDIPAMVPHTETFKGKYFCTTPSAPKERTDTTDLLVKELRKIHNDVFVAPDVKEAMESAQLLLSDKGGLILVTGSLYTVADASRWLEEQKTK